MQMNWLQLLVESIDGVLDILIYMIDCAAEFKSVPDIVWPVLLFHTHKLFSIEVIIGGELYIMFRIMMAFFDPFGSTQASQMYLFWST